MRRTTARLLTVAAVVGTLTLPVVAANAETLATFQNPINGCTYTLTGPKLTVTTLPNPGVTKTGGVGESVSCP